jgi:hypothetical protein
MVDKDFLIEPPTAETVTDSGLDEMYATPQTLDAAWTKYIMEFHLPKDLQEVLVRYTKPLVDLAPKTYILRAEIPMHLLEYDLVWMRYRLFMHKGKFDPKLQVYKEIIRHALELQLNRSVDGWQGNLLFTRKYEVMQTHREKQMGRIARWFKGKPSEEERGR